MKKSIHVKSPRPIPAKAKRLFAYEITKGKLYWEERPLSDFVDRRAWKIWNTKFAFKEAGSTTNLGYITVQIDNKAYRAHRIIPYIMRSWNKTHLEVDHKDGKPYNNAWANLRQAPHQKNSCNLKLAINNTSGTTGVRLCSNRRVWEAYIMVHRKKHHLGYYKSKSAAIRARKEAEQRYFGKYVRSDEHK